jgi:Ca2+:H+ antiporter
MVRSQYLSHSAERQRTIRRPRVAPDSFIDNATYRIPSAPLSPRRTSNGELILTDDMTLKDRQDAINQSHVFGMPLWKPSLYKKARTIDNLSYSAVHETPQPPSGGWLADWHVDFGNVCWLLFFGWWMSLVYVALTILMAIASLGLRQGRQYAWLFAQMAGYVLWPFGKFVERLHTGQQAIFATSPVAESQPLLGDEFNNAMRNDDDDEMNAPAPTCTFSFGEWISWLSPVKLARRIGNLGWSGTVFYALLIAVAAPIQLLVSVVNWLCVVSIPMAKLNFVLLQHMYNHPLTIRTSTMSSILQRSVLSGEILLCTYKAIGLHYYKYTIDGINILFINLLPVVLFALLDGFFLGPALHHTGIGHPLVIFGLCLVSVIPLAYFIGMAVASISSQSSFGNFYSVKRFV